MTLNGWQRLWIVVSTVYAVVLVLLGVIVFPTPDTIEHRAQFYDELPSESLAILKRADASSTRPPGTGRDFSYELFCDDPQAIVFAINNHKLCFIGRITETEKRG